MELWGSKLSAVARLARYGLASAMICYRDTMCRLSCETRPLGEYEGGAFEVAAIMTVLDPSSHLEDLESSLKLTF